MIITASKPIVTNKNQNVILLPVWAGAVVGRDVTVAVISGFSVGVTVASAIVGVTVGDILGLTVGCTVGVGVLLGIS